MIKTLRTLHLNLQSSIEHTYNPEIVVDAMQHYCLVTDSLYVTFNNVSIHRYSDLDYFEPPLHSRDCLRFRFPSTCLRGNIGRRCETLVASARREEAKPGSV